MNDLLSIIRKNLERQSMTNVLGETNKSASDFGGLFASYLSLIVGLGNTKNFC
jgi:hypothetical protein